MLRRWKRSRARTALLATGAVGFVLLWGLEIAAERGGHSLDPTDAMNYNTYALHNDSAGPLSVHLCADAQCRQLDSHTDWITVLPGSVTDEEVYWGSDVSAVYAVASDSTAGSTRWCLVLSAATKAAATVDAPLSLAGRCGSA